MKNREVYWRDPLTVELLNNGVSKVAEIEDDPEQIKTLRFELETFVCDGEYAHGRGKSPATRSHASSGFFGPQCSRL